MQNQKLLDAFTALVDRYAEHQGFIEKAQAAASRYTPKVVDRVVRDHTERARAVQNDIDPQVDRMTEAVSTIQAERRAASDEQTAQQTKLEELELRQVIGELDEDAFEAEASAIRADLDKATREVEALSSEESALTAALGRWSELSGAPLPDLSETVREPEPEPEPEEEVADLDADFDEPEVDDVPGLEPDESDSIHVDDDAEPVAGDPLLAGFDDDDGEAMGDPISLDTPWPSDEGQTPLPSGGAAEGSRKAVLIYAEGTPEEQIYPLVNDMLTVGRGRTNDIQVRNDSKVSRVHAKVYQRGDQFFIEDNKSSNGTLVNGELITERRLFGGEELIIGETYFRFQLRD